MAVSSRRREVLKHGLMGAILIAVFFPFAVLLINSMKSPYQFWHTEPWEFAFPLHLVENYRYGLAKIWPALLNTTFYSIVVCGAVVVLAAFSAFVFARFRFRGRELLFGLIIALMMVPGFLSLFPAFMLNKYLGLLDSRWVMILPYVAAGQVLGIFLLRVFFESQPAQLFEAARIDGAGDFQMFWHVGVPLCAPMMATLAIMNALALWNDLIWPYMTLGDTAKWPVALAIFNMFQDGGISWGTLFAAYVLASLPLLILFFFASGYFVRGLSSGALKL